MRVALCMANMLKAETLAGRKADGTVAFPSHLSPDHDGRLIFVGAHLKSDFGHIYE